MIIIKFQYCEKHNFVIWGFFWEEGDNLIFS